MDLQWRDGNARRGFRPISSGYRDVWGMLTGWRRSGVMEAALAEGIAPGVVLADSGYGNSSAFRDRIADLGLEFSAGITGKTTVWPEGAAPSCVTSTGYSLLGCSLSCRIALAQNRFTLLGAMTLR